MTGRPSLLVTSAALALCLALAGGCAKEPVLGGSGDDGPTAGTPVQAETVTIEALTPARKRSAIATSFPAEVPVPGGEFVRARAQGDDAWDYEVLVAAPADVVAQWYRDAYVGRQWSLIGDESDARGTGSRTLSFSKGRAQSSVTVHGSSEPSDGASTRVVVVLGVGAPVLQTQ